MKYRLIFCVAIGALIWMLIPQPLAKYAQAAEGSSITAAYQAAANACTDGYYRDLTDNTCRQLVKSYGFDQQQFQQNFSNREYTLSTCTEAALQELFEDIRGQGGQINLPACTLTIDHSFPIPSNTILQGAGVGRTIFKAGSGFSGNVVKTKYEQNIIIRDISVDGGNRANSGILVWYSNNALVERVDVYNSKNSGIVFRFAKQITIRYSESHGHRTYHGIDSKDCHPRSSTPDSQECANAAGPVSPGSLWSTDYAVYSNRLYNNGTHGINSHATHGEVAGNLIYDNRYGSKFPDATYTWIHHNKFSNNDKVGSWVYATLDSSVRVASKIAYFKNTFSGNRGYPVDLDDPAREIYLIDNQYQGNQPNRLSISKADAFVCDNKSEQSIGYDGSPAPSTAPAQKCDLSQIAHIFGHDGSAPSPPQPTNTPVPATVAPTALPTATPTNTAVAVGTTAVPPTSTPLLPTSAPTRTAVPPTNTPANTPLPPTSAPTSTAVPPTSAPTNTAVSTATAQPANSPTLTPTPSPTPSDIRGTYALQVPGRIEAEAYKTGGPGIGYYDTTSGNAGSALRADDVDSEPSKDEGAGYNIGWIAEGEWLAYDILVQRSGIYKLIARVNTWDGDTRRLHVTLNGQDITGAMEFDASAGHRVWTDVTKTGIQIPAGRYELKIHMDTGGFNLNYIDLSVQSADSLADPQLRITEAANGLPGPQLRAKSASGNANTKRDIQLFLPVAHK